MTEQRGVVRSFLQSALAACVAEAATLPFDTAKVRLQLQSSTGSRQRSGPLSALIKIVREEGVLAPYKGLSAGLHRQFLFTGLRLGLYPHVREWCSGSEGQTAHSLQSRILAALVTSACGITAANPSDVVKVRFQARHGPIQAWWAPTSHRGTGHSYRTSLHAYRQIAREEGVIGGLYKVIPAETSRIACVEGAGWRALPPLDRLGYRPNLIRNCIISATELVAYDTAKTELLQAGFQDGMAVHFSAGMSAGLLATILGSPMDVIATRLMAQQTAKGVPPMGLVPFCASVLRREGILAFWKGFVPNFARIGSFNIVMWLSYEQISRRLV